MPQKPEKKPSITDHGFPLARFRQGDPVVFKQVYSELSQPLLFSARNITRSAIEAEDIVANAFYELYCARQTMQSYVHIKNWLFLVVRNESIDYLRRKDQKREIELDLNHLSDPDEPYEKEIPEAFLLHQLSEAIERLAPQQKTIFCLYFLEHKKTVEIAKALNLNSQTVLNHKGRAVKALRKTIFRPDWLLYSLLEMILQFVFS